MTTIDQLDTRLRIVEVDVSKVKTEQRILAGALIVLVPLITSLIVYFIIK